MYLVYVVIIGASNYEEFAICIRGLKALSVDVFEVWEDFRNFRKFLIIICSREIVLELVVVLRRLHHLHELLHHLYLIMVDRLVSVKLLSIHF